MDQREQRQQGRPATQGLASAFQSASTGSGSTLPPPGWVSGLGMQLEHVGRRMALEQERGDLLQAQVGLLRAKESQSTALGTPSGPTAANHHLGCDAAVQASSPGCTQRSAHEQQPFDMTFSAQQAHQGPSGLARCRPQSENRAAVWFPCFPVPSESCWLVSCCHEGFSGLIARKRRSSNGSDHAGLAAQSLYSGDVAASSKSNSLLDNSVLMDDCSPGVYRIIRRISVGSSLSEKDGMVAMVNPGDVVHVVEVAYNSDEGRIRGRLVYPDGWISLSDARTGACWAASVTSASQVAAAGQQALAGSTAEGGIGRRDESGLAFSSATSTELEDLKRRLYSAEVRCAEADLNVAMLAKRCAELESNPPSRCLTSNLSSPVGLSMQRHRPQSTEFRDMNVTSLVSGAKTIHDMVVEYFTDVEGNWTYMLNFVSKSKILDWSGETRGVWGPGELTLKENGILVFGGDAPDKGPGDIRIVKTLVKLKRRYPLQVFIVLGNRDLMKMRFRAELDEGMENLSNPWLPPWDPHPKPLSEFLQEQKLERNRIGKLKWMLHCNMGCQDTTFSTRKEELALLHGKASDEDVLQSYTDSVDLASNDPWMLEFLRVGQLAVILGDTLFVHGGLQDESAGHVPGRDGYVKSVHEWVKELNAWKASELRNFEQSPKWHVGTDGKVTRGGAALIEYGTPGAGKRTVIYHNPFVNGNPVQKSPCVRDFLEKSGIRRLITGHQPHGQSPTVVRHPDTGLLVVTADTSRSDPRGNKVINPADNRGNALSIVRLEGPQLIVEGEMNDGQPHGFSLHCDPNLDELPDALVGRQLADESWVKTVLRGGGDQQVVTALGQGFNVIVREMPVQSACLRLRSEYGYGWGGTFAIKLQDVLGDKLTEATRGIEGCPNPDDACSSSPSSCQLRSSEFDGAQFHDAETYILAFHGVVVDPATPRGKQIISNINRIIAAKKRVVFITNDSTMSRASFLDKLTSDYDIEMLESAHSRATLEQCGGEHLPDGEKQASLRRLCVVTSSYTCAWFLARSGIKKPFVICYGTGLIEELEDAGIKNYVAVVNADGSRKKEFLQPVSKDNISGIIERAPDVDAVVVGWDHQLTALTIAVAAQYIRWNHQRRKPIPVITCSMDDSGILGWTSSDFGVPQLQGRKVCTVGIGTMARAICNCTELNRTPIDVGKPSEMLLELLRQPADQGGLGVNLASAVVVGGNLKTDVQLAWRGGMRSLLVLNGVTSKEFFNKQQQSADKLQAFPTWVVDSFADIYDQDEHMSAEPHTASHAEDAGVFASTMQQPKSQATPVGRSVEPGQEVDSSGGQCGADKQSVIEYLTDVEGNWTYMLRFVSQSKILAWSSETRGVWGPGDLTLKENGILVFGGDAPDKGPGDIRIVKILVKLKRQYPSQVFIVLGNRDLMKLRFLAELDEEEENLSNPWLPTWDPRPKPLSEFLQEQRLERDRIGKLKWMLHCNMGCQDTTFGTRKEELALLHGRASDEDVLQSYTCSVDPKSNDPWMLEFLRMGQLAVILEDTLFVHGGLQDESAGHVPGKGEHFQSVQEWVEELNAWKARELHEFEQSPRWHEGADGKVTRGGAALIEYGTPGAGKRTVIYHNPFVDGNPVQRSPRVRDFLSNSGIRRLITGHQPHGQSPTVVRHPGTGLLAVTADTSRSDSSGNKVLNPANNRGNALSIVRIEGPCLVVEGVLNDGRSHAFRLHCDPNADELPDALVGRQLTDGSWVKTVIGTGDDQKVIAALGKGFSVISQEIPVRQACLRLKSEYGWGGTFAIKLQDLVCDASMDPRQAVTSVQLFSNLDADEGQASVALQRCNTWGPIDRTEFDAAETYIFSFNGVVRDPTTEVGAKIIRNINRLIAASKRVVFITNDSTMSCSSFFDRLTDQLGIRMMECNSPAKVLEGVDRVDLPYEEEKASMSGLCVVTSCYTCAWFLKRSGIRKPFVICHGTGLVEELENAGIKDYVAVVNADGSRKEEFLQPVSKESVSSIIERAPDVDAVVVGWDHQLTALTMAVAAQYIRWSDERGKSIPIISCSMDAGGIVGWTSSEFGATQFRNHKVNTIGNGTMAHAICGCTELRRAPIDVGKPSEMLLEYLRRPAEEGGLGVDFATAVVVGDSLKTDVRLACRGGMRSLLVLSGVTSREQLEKEKGVDANSLPTWVVDSFADVYD